MISCEDANKIIACHPAIRDVNFVLAAAARTVELLYPFQGYSEASVNSPSVYTLTTPKEVDVVLGRRQCASNQLADHSNGALVLGFTTDSVSHERDYKILKCDTKET